MSGRLLVSVSGGGTDRRSAVEQVVTLARELGLPPPRVDDLRLAVHECLVNAFEHGHLGDAAEEILVEVAGEGHGVVTVRVRDRARGGGWDPAPRACPAAAAMPSVLAERGRGLALVVALTDDCTIHTDPGSTTVAFRLGVPASSRPPASGGPMGPAGPSRA